MNLVNLLEQRKLGKNINSIKFHGIMENKFNNNNECIDYSLKSEVVLSTIAISISHNGELVASTHGDHTVKVFEHHTGEIIRIFNGHPRTPWTVKFHPTNSNFLASGCLGCEVRVWDIANSCCRSVVRLEYSIISLAFQPSETDDCGDFIAVASGPHLHMWEWKNQQYAVRPGTQNIAIHQVDHIPYVLHSRNIRAVMFHPTGKIVFAAAPDPPRLTNVPSSPCRLYTIQVDKDTISALTEPISLSSFPAIIPQIHLYSDGGMDISPDGNYIFTCTLLNVDTLSSVADGRVYNEQSAALRVDNNSSRDKSSGPFTLSFDQITSALMRYVSLTDNDGEGKSSPSRTNPTKNNNQRDSNQVEILDKCQLKSQSKFDDIDKPFPRPSIIPSKYLIQMNPVLNLNRQLQNNNNLQQQQQHQYQYENTRGFNITFADPKIPVQDGRWQVEERLCLFKIQFPTEKFPESTPIVYLVNSTPLTDKLMRAVTSIKLSPTGRYGLIGYGVRNNGIVENHLHRKVASEVIDLMTMESQSVMTDDIDEVNIAQFHPISGCGIIYGTKRGKVRIYR